MEKLVVVGSILIDFAAYTPAFAEDGVTMIGESLKVSPGGKGYNQAAAAKLAGADVTMVGKLGADFFSDYLFAHYEKIGFRTNHLIRDPKEETGSAVIEINTQSGENRIILLKGANDSLCAEDVLAAEEAFAESKLVLTQLETGISAIQQTKALAQKYKKPLVINTAPFRPVPEDLLADVDYVTPNETEAEYFTGIRVTDLDTARQAARVLLDKGVKNVIITLGGNGSYYTDGVTEYKVPAVKAGTVVDTTGAGDSFNAGFCVALAEGKSVLEALRFAACAAGLKVTRKGSSIAMPRREEIDRLYAGMCWE